MSTGAGRAVWLPLCALAAFACEGNVMPDDGEGGSGSSSSGGTGAVGGECRTVDGLRVCGGAHDCGDDSTLDDCGCYPIDSESVDIGVCANEIVDFLSMPTGCPDGFVKLNLGAPAKLCAPFSLGMLFCENKASDAVRFVDNAAFDCAPLPEPDTCPPTSGIQLCGDVCGPCGPAEICTGRSRAHPYSLCLPQAQGYCSPSFPECETGQRCLVYLLDAIDQAIADKNGMCVPQALCEAAVTELPGGAKCVGP